MRRRARWHTAGTRRHCGSRRLDVGGWHRAATGILNAAKLADRESLDALEGIRFTPAGTAAAAAVLGAGPTGDALWAATYVYASSPGDSAPLLTVAASSTASASVRVMAAAGLTAAGKLEGLDALVGLLGAAGAMDGAEPPDSVWAVAADVLERYTHAGVGPPGAGDEAARTASAAAWSAWLAAKRDHLRFDAPNALWVAA